MLDKLNLDKVLRFARKQPNRTIYLDRSQLSLGYNEAIASLQPFDGITDHLVNNLLGWQFVVDNGSGFTHKERSGIVEGIIVNIIAQGFHIVFDWNLSSASELLDLLSAVLLPVGDVWIIADTKWTTLSYALV